MANSQDVEIILQSYESAGLSRLSAIKTAIQEEKLERDPAGKLKLRPATRKPGRQLLGL
jgi:hypothetical protein